MITLKDKHELLLHEQYIDNNSTDVITHHLFNLTNKRKF